MRFCCYFNMQKVQNTDHELGLLTNFSKYIIKSDRSQQRCTKRSLTHKMILHKSSNYETGKNENLSEISAYMREHVRPRCLRYKIPTSQHLKPCALRTLVETAERYQAKFLILQTYYNKRSVEPTFHYIFEHQEIKISILTARQIGIALKQSR